MDYDNPQFIAAVKRILRDGMAHLADSLNDLKDAVHAHWQADAKSYQTKPISVADLRTDVPISVKTYAQRSTKERVWGLTKGALEIAVAVAVITYTVVSYEQWKELAKANDVAMSNFRRERIDSNEQSKESQKQTAAAQESARAAQRSVELTVAQFQIDQRPFISIAEYQLLSPDSNEQISSPIVGKPLFVNVIFKVFGKSIAFHTITHRHIIFGDSAIEPRYEPPDKDKDRIGDSFAPGDTQSMTAVTVKDTYATESAGVNHNDLVAWDGSYPIVIFGRITYKDSAENEFCTPYMTKLLPSGAWLRIEGMKKGPIRETVNLCPHSKEIIWKKR